MLIPLLQLTAATDCRLVDTTGPSERVVLWTIKAPDAPLLSRERSKLNLALVIDRSGSMEGDKLAYAKRAASHALDLLNEHDRVALVAYDDRIEILAPSQPVTPTSRAALKKLINGLSARGSTNLLPFILGAVKARATLGEIADALRSVFGEYRPS